MINKKICSIIRFFLCFSTRLSELNFPSTSLRPVAGHGIQASVYNAYIRIDGRVHYRYKKKWISISDSIGVTIKARRIRFDLTFDFGKNAVLLVCVAEKHYVSMFFTRFWSVHKPLLFDTTQLRMRINQNGKQKWSGGRKMTFLLISHQSTHVPEK